MHKVGLKLWSTNSFYIKLASELYEKNVFDYIELYVVPGSREEFIHIWAQMDIPFMLHGPHSFSGLNFSLPDYEDGNRKLIDEIELFREALNPRKIIFHPGSNGSIEETIRQINRFKNEYKSLFEQVLIENKPRMGLNGERCIGATPEEMEKILCETETGFCLDIGHAICYAAWAKSGWKTAIDKFVQLHPEMYHLSDGDLNSPTDSHPNYGKGNYDMEGILELLPPDASVSIETDKKSRTNLNDYEEDVAFFRKCAQKAEKKKNLT